MDFTLFQNYLDSPAVSSICSYGSENNLAATTSVELSSSYDVITATAASSAQPSTTTTSIYCQQNQYQPQQQYQQQLQYDPMMTRRSPSGSYNTRLSQTRRTSSSNDDTTGMETNTRGGSLNSGHLQQTLTDVMNEIERFSEQNGSVNGNIKRKRKDMDEMSNVSMDSKVLRMAASPMPSNSSTGHNTSHVGDSEKRSVRQNHSEIEKRRRNKMNNYINQLSNLIPTCASVNRKMDKLTVLRLAVQHLKAVRGSIHAYSQSTSRPSNLNDSDLIRLILKSSKDEAGFLFVVDSARGRILYVSESVAKVLNYTQRDLFGQSLFDVLHPKDIAKVKEQMSSNSVSQHHSRDRPASSTFDGKPNLLKNEAGGSSKINAHKIAASGSGDAEPAPVSALPWLCPGARRSFFCRMKTKPGSFFKEEDSIDQDSCQRRKRVNGDKKYRVIQCTGYLKSWSSSSGLPHSGNDEDPGDQNDPSMSTFGAMDCLVAVGRLQTTIEKPIDDAIARGLEIVPGVEFSARHSIDGMFAFICPKATPILGYLPQELQGSSVYEHILYDDIPPHKKIFPFSNSGSHHQA